MSDEDGAERTISRPGESTAEADRTAGADRTADAFLELEAELDADTGPASDRTTGLVVDAATVPADRVPDGYPLAADAEEVLSLTLAIDDGRETTAYLAWPSDGTVDPDSRPPGSRSGVS